MALLRRLILTIFNGPSCVKVPEHDVLSDEELVSQIIKTNNSMLFGVLYDRFGNRVYNKCMGFVKNEAEAKDLTQDIFLKLFVKLSNFKGNSKFSTWLYAFTYNFCVNYVKRDKEKKIDDMSDRMEDHDYHLSQLADVEERELFEMKVHRLDKALELIDPEDKTILLLKYQDDVSLKELGALLALGGSAVKMRLKRAKIKVLVEYKSLKI